MQPQFQVARSRLALTLIELIVVIAVMAILLGLTLVLFPRLQDSQRVAKGADVLQGQLFLAKQMALRDQMPYGVRLIPDPADGLIHQLQLIEQPLPFTSGVVTSVSSTATPTTPPSYQVTLSAAFATGTIQTGDFLDLTPNDCYTEPNSTHALHYIVSAHPPNTLLVLTQPILPSPVPAELALPYRVIRSPRPALGINSVSLPDDVVIDCPLSASHPAAPPGWAWPVGSLGLPPAGPQDILFAPSGKALGTRGGHGKVILWLYDPTNGTPEQALVAVHELTGCITAQPVNINRSLGVPPGNPYWFVQDGRTSGM